MILVAWSEGDVIHAAEVLYEPKELNQHAVRLLESNPEATQVIAYTARQGLLVAIYRLKLEKLAQPIRQDIPTVQTRTRWRSGSRRSITSTTDFLMR